MFILSINFVSLLAVGFSAKILESPQVSNFGDWGDWERCLPGEYVVGFQLRTEAWIGPLRDDTSLNGIHFYCEPPGEEASSTSYKISSSVGQFGEFGSIFGCRGLAVGFQLKSELPEEIDNTAANNLRVVCSTSENVLEGDGERWGDWTETQHCDEKQAICAIQVQLESFQGGTDDDTSLNNLRSECCDVPNPASQCTPSDEFLFLLQCDNREGSGNMSCMYNYNVGVSYAVQGAESEAYESIGFQLDTVGNALSGNFEENLGTSPDTEVNWATVGEETWTPRVSTQSSSIVPPGYIANVYLARGHCGMYLIESNEIDIRIN